MARQRTIVAIGEAILCEYGDRAEPGGLAVACARQAAALGHAGVIISRIGQDLAGEALLNQVRALGVNTDHLQSDPDLPTGRLIVRVLAGKVSRSLSARAAFDNLQWDFDLADVAQQADAVIFGALAQREGQSRSIIKRFLAECSGALRVFDLTNRQGDAIDRAEARSGLEFAQGLVADATALKALAPDWDGREARQAASTIMRGTPLGFVLEVAGPNRDAPRSLRAHAADQSWTAPRGVGPEHHEAALLRFVHGLINGWDFEKSLESAVELQDRSHAPESK